MSRSTGRHRMKTDPRTRMVLALIALIGAAALQRPVSIGAVSVALLAGIPLLGRTRMLIGSLRLILPVTVLVFVVSVLSFDWQTAVLASLRLLNLLLVAGLFFQLTGPEDLAAGLRQWKVPYPLIFILVTSLRYVPLLTGRIRAIVEAQRSRGIDMRRRLGNLKNLTALLLPLLVQSFLLAEQLAVAMEARGFSRKGRSCRHRYRIQPVEYLVMAAGLALMGGFLWWDRS